MPGKNLTRAEAADRAALISVASYDVVLDLTTGDTTFRTTTTVTFEAEAGASTFIDAFTAEVHQVTLNGQDLDPALVADGARIQLPELAEQNVLVVEADMFYTNTGEGLHRFVDPVDREVYLYSQFEVADTRRMFPVFEQPDLKSRFAFTVTAPDHWQVISNQPTPEPAAAGDGKATWAFSATPLLPPYITALVAGPYDVVRDELTSSDGRTIPLGVFARKSLMEYVDAEEIFEITKQGFEFYEAQFDTPYPFEKYDQLFVPQFNAGAMENAGCVTFVEAYVFRSRPTQARVERRVITVLHELAHMWFGNLVTMRWWNDLWLNESFAEYASTLASAQATRYDNAWTTFAAMEKSWAFEQDQLPTTHPVKAEISDLEDVLVNFDGITYAKGASVLKQLVAWVGQEQFMQGLRTYFAKHGWANAELKDLMAELESASGRDLKDWTSRWLEDSGVNTLRPDCVRDDDNIMTSFAIVQTAPDEYPVLRPHRLAIGFYDVDDSTGQLVRNHRVEIDVEGSRTEVPELVGVEAPDLVLVNDDDLAYAKIRLDEYSQDTVTEHLKDFAESLPRALVWQAAWDGVHDAVAPARGYVETVLNNIGAETDSTTVQVQLRQLDTVLDGYIAEEDREAFAVDAAERLWHLVVSAEPGSDNQLQFVRAYARRARTAQQLDRIDGLDSGELLLDGLEIDTDLRWALLTSLTAGGRVGADAVDAALSRDDTEHGAIAAAQARAAIPTAEAKASVWDSVVEVGSMPNSLQEAAIAGFRQAPDDDLLSPYVAKYFETVTEIYRERSHEIAEQIAVGMFPRIPRQSTVDAADAFLAGLPENLNGLRRLVLEGRDRVARAVAAQEVDTRAQA
ncbi:aminopeptidase N [Kocuria coralli]|uniref:Aminopeptidase N n=1 Tax=Kocuria coralli TaxID=1461025 RepID=A0A5J5KWK6_9MICC|nr:aminopeptidase N [Kocuria coralli]KAA9394039.1 aminopeptidase N [Kocuria coralli]